VAHINNDLFLLLLLLLVTAAAKVITNTTTTTTTTITTSSRSSSNSSTCKGATSEESTTFNAIPSMSGNKHSYKGSGFDVFLEKFLMEFLSEVGDSSSFSSISFNTLLGFWLSPPGHSKPSHSAAVLSN
jgi:putative Ca2+/H+ antiporter (TMEM165/GDT1 family)